MYKLASDEKIVKEYTCDEVTRPVSIGYKTSVILTDKRIIRVSHGKKWGRRISKSQDVDLDCISGFSSYQTGMNKYLMAILFLGGLLFTLVGLVFYVIGLTKVSAQNPDVLLALGPMLVTLGVSIIGIGRSSNQTKGQFGLPKIMLFLVGLLFAATGLCFVIITLFSPEIFKLLFAVYEFIITLFIAPIGAVMIAVCFRLKPYMCFEIQIRYSVYEFSTTRRHSILESFIDVFRRKRNKSVKLRIPLQMQEMFAELPALVRDLRKPIKPKSGA